MKGDIHEDRWSGCQGKIEISNEFTLSGRPSPEIRISARWCWVFILVFRCRETLNDGTLPEWKPDTGTGWAWSHPLGVDSTASIRWWPIKKSPFWLTNIVSRMTCVSVLSSVPLTVNVIVVLGVLTFGLQLCLVLFFVSRCWRLDKRIRDALKQPKAASKHTGEYREI